ncbi:MAG: hypothetical protein JRI92_07185 [Deltaproteobacteria bacterium]|nr:hypothetical protein [Deltaproteobacteria bacterium]
MTAVFAIFIILHGLAHLWYVTLSLNVIPFKSEFGWSGDSWLLTNFISGSVSPTIATIVYAIAALGLVCAGVGLLMDHQLFRPIMLWSAILSLSAIGLFWDGNTSQIIEKGLIGFVINVIVIIGLLLL